MQIHMYIYIYVYICTHLYHIYIARSSTPGTRLLDNAELAHGALGPKSSRELRAEQEDVLLWKCLAIQREAKECATVKVIHTTL